MSKMQLFFEKNSYLLGEPDSPKIEPNKELTVLRLGLLNFYETYQASLEGGTRMYTYKIIPGADEGKAFLNPGMGCPHEYLARYYTSVSYIQLFLELYILDILDNISRNFARTNISESDFKQKILDGSLLTLSANDRTVNYSKILKRLYALIELNDSIPEDLRIPEKYHFFNKHRETLEILQKWRNEIMHSGSRVLYYYSYEVLFVNLVLPLVAMIVAIEPNTVFLNRNLHCGINVIQELCRIKLPLDYLNIGLSDEVADKLNWVNHLKELGRASFNNQLFMKEYGDENLARHYEPHNSKLRENAEIETDAIRGPLGYFQRFICPCCGTYSLLTFDYWTETKNGRTRPYKAKCILCTYKIGLDIGEPMVFNIMKERIYNYID